MKNKTILKGLIIHGEEGILYDHDLLVADGVIQTIAPNLSDQEAQVYSFPSSYHLIPGRIDLHIHGAAGSDVMDGTWEALDTIARKLPEEGVTAFLGTTMTESVPAIEKALINGGNFFRQQKQGARLLGVHLEGPFLSPVRCGAQAKEYLLLPDLSLFQRWQALSGDIIRLVTLAPELPGAGLLISYLRDTGVVPAIGHSNATYEEALAGIDAGAIHMTHLFNGMTGLHHRDPGVAGAGLFHQGVSVELIADGIHVHHEMIRLAYQLKGKDRIFLVSDAIRAKYMGDGNYKLGGQDVVVCGGKATLTNGTLAGSVLKLDEGVKRLIQASLCTLEDSIFFTSVNPAKQLNVYDRKGSITPGKDGDLVVLDDRYDVVMTLCRGKIAYQR